MSGFFKRAKNKAKGVTENLRPPSGQGRSPSPAPSTQAASNSDSNPALTPATSGLNAVQPASSLAPTRAAPLYARPPEPPSALSTTGSVIHELLKTIRDASDMCLPLKAAIIGVLKIWDVCERTAQLNQEFTKHKEKLERLLKITITHQTEGELSDNLRERLEEIAAALQDLANAVQAKLDRGLTSRVLQSDSDIGKIKDLVDKTMSLIDVFEFEGGIRVEIGVEQVKSGVEQIQRELLEAKRRQAVKESEKNLERHRNHISAALDKHHVREAVYDAQQRSGCMEGTRVEVLDHVIRWIMDPKAQPIFWLGGMAGTGKTAIAWSICERVQADETMYLGGSFFCSRSTGSAAQRDVRYIIPTLAQLLARQSDEFATALAAELKKEPDLAYKQVKVQVDRLLCKPLTAISSSTRTVVFIIDALDECGEQPTATVPGDNSQAHAAVTEMLEALIDFSRSSAGLPIKFIVTSRPETHIRETSVTDIKVTSALHLHTIDKSLATNDIRLYISKTLSKALATETWFTSDHVETLAKRADGLFIFAATATKYILGGGKGLRAKRLANLVSPQQAIPAALVIAPLDLMYSSILMEASRADMVEDDDLQQMLKVVAAILSARVTLSVEALSELLDLQTEYLRGCLDRLHAVIHLPEDDRDASLRALHASFGDYLFTRAAAGIRIAATLGHDELAHGCLRRMSQDDLGFNISRSPSSHEPNPKPRLDLISLSLRYACLHWAHHIHSASAQYAFEEVINAVFRPKFLFWLEVLSVLGEVSRASGLLRIAGFATKSAEISQFLRDANSFVASSRAAIEWSTPHIYLSALPFAPKDSLVYQDFASLLSGVASVETFGIDRHGGRLVMNLTGHEGAVFSVAYSPDGRLLTSGSTDGTVRLWDTLTGEEAMAPLQSGDGTVLCVAFAADGQRVVSCTEGGAVHVWDVRTGHAAMPPLRGHSGTVYSVALSQDGRLIASASADHSVRLWDANTGQVIAVLAGHERDVRSVAFSLDGHILASGSQDYTVRLWNVHNCDLQGPPLRGADSYVLSVAFSPDSTLIAAGYYATQEIRIWTVFTGEEIITLKAACPIKGLVFAPEGSYLAFPDLHGIRFCDVKTGQDVKTVLSGHSGSVEALSRSPNGFYIATASKDCTIRIWDAEHGQSMTSQLPSHTNNVNSVVVSANGTFIVSGSADRTIRVWDSQTAQSTLPPLMGHSDAVLSVALSADGQFIASGSADCTVRLWNAKTGELVGELIESHKGQVNAVIFSRDGLWLASASADCTAGLWAIASDQLSTIYQLPCDHAALSVAFSSDGRRLVVGDSWGCADIWDVSGDTQTKLAVFNVNLSAISSVCFSPDDSRVATASYDGNVYLWDLGSQSLLLTLEGHSGYVRAVAYSPDGQYIASGSNDRNIRLWDVGTGEAVAVLHGHKDYVRSVSFSPDGKSLVSGDDGVIRSWNTYHSAALSSEDDLSPVDILARARLHEGWLVGASEERLIWVPQEYRSNLMVDRSCAMLIARNRIVLSASTVFNHGTEWERCWRGA